MQFTNIAFQKLLFSLVMCHCRHFLFAYDAWTVTELPNKVEGVEIPQKWGIPVNRPAAEWQRWKGFWNYFCCLRQENNAIVTSGNRGFSSSYRKSVSVSDPLRFDICWCIERERERESVREGGGVSCGELSSCLAFSDGYKVVCLEDILENEFFNCTNPQEFKNFKILK